MPPLNVIQESVVGFADYRIDIAGLDANFGILAQHVRDDGIGDQPDIERVREHNGGFQRAEFTHLLEANTFSESIQRIYSRRDFVFEQIAIMWQDRSYAGANWPLARNEWALPLNKGDMPDTHAFHICDGIEWAGR